MSAPFWPAGFLQLLLLLSQPVIFTVCMIALLRVMLPGDNCSFSWLGMKAHLKRGSAPYSASPHLLQLVVDLMRQVNGKAAPSKALVKGLARELDISEAYLDKLAEDLAGE